MATSQDFVNWVCSDALNPHFLKYVLLAERDSFARFSYGTTHQTIYFPEVKAFHIALPPRSEQDAIVDVLGALDDKIDLNRRMSETLEEMARALFKSWFIDFDPVRAKAEGRQPAGMDAETAALFPAEFEGDLPKGWSAVPLRDAGQWVSGGTPSKGEPRYWGGSIPWFSAKSMHSLVLDDAEEHVTEAGAETGTRLVPARSVLFVVRGMSLADEFRLGMTTRAATLNQDLKAIVPNGAVPPPLVLWFLASHHDAVLALTDEASHGTKRLKTDAVEALSLNLPPPAVQTRLAASFDVLFDKLAVAKSESRTLAELRDTLLPKLMSGELRVRDAEKIAGKVS